MIKFSFQLALVVTSIYFAVTLVFGPWARCVAQRLVGRFVLLSKAQGLVSRWVLCAVEIMVFFLSVFLAAHVCCYIFGISDPVEALGLARAPAKGKVVMTIPRNVMGAGVDITQPYLHYQESSMGPKYFLSFKFRIFKGAKDKELKITGGKFVIRAFVAGELVDEREVAMDGGFIVSDEDLTGTYVSPGPFVLNVVPESVELLWIMESADGRKIISKKQMLAPLRLGL